MSLDQNLTPAAPEITRGPAIENEIATYRAISPLAVVSLILGVLSLLCFADYSFLLCAAAAVVLGVMADRKIQRFPDVLTGRGLAQAGIALGLVFSLASMTTGTVQFYLRKHAAQTFTRGFINVLRTGTLQDAYWYTQPPDVRKSKSPAEVYKDLQTRLRDPFELEMHIGSLKSIKNRLAAAPGEEIHFSKIENLGDEGLGIVAHALLELDGPPTKDFPEKEQFALVIMKADSRKSKYEWWIEDIRFPYTPSSYVLGPKPVDDGHGHSHAH